MRNTSMTLGDYLRVGVFTLLLVLLMQGMNLLNEVEVNHEAAKAYRGEDGYVVMQGHYEANGLIMTDDGHEWIWLHEEPLAENTVVDVIFRTNHLEETKWEIVTVEAN